MIIICLSICSTNYTIDLNSIDFFTEEICSYNGTPEIKVIDGKRQVVCKCIDEYGTDKTVRTINGNAVQCSYKFKRRLTCLFYALLLPFGISDLYLSNQFMFFVIFFISLIGCLSGIVFLVKEERYHQTKTMRHERERDQRWFLIGRWAVYIFFSLFISYWIINLLLVITGIRKDGNGFSMYNDLSFITFFFTD